MPESNRFASVDTPVVSHTPADDVVSSPFARQSSRFAPDSSFFMCHSRPMTGDITELMTVISAPISLIIARSFHLTAVIPATTALITVIIALMFLTIRWMFVMAARISDITGVMSDVVRIM
jgi:hypothetical protein